MSSAQKKYGEILKAAYSKPPTESVPSTSLKMTSTSTLNMSVSTANQYPVRQAGGSTHGGSIHATAELEEEKAKSH